MSKPLVLHVRSATGYGGGPEKTILNSPRFLDPLGYDAACAYLHHPGDEKELLRRAEEAAAPFISVPDRGRLDWRPVKRLVDICRQKKVAIWHSHDYKTDLIGLLVRRFWKMKLVTTVHGWVSQTRMTPLYYRLNKFTLPFYDGVICVSEDLYAECQKAGVSPDRCHLIHNAIDIQQFLPTTDIESKKKQTRRPVRSLYHRFSWETCPRKEPRIACRSSRCAYQSRLSHHFASSRRRAKPPRTRKTHRETGP